MKQVQKIFFIHTPTIEYNIRAYDVIFFSIEQLIFREYLRVLNLVLAHRLMMLLALGKR